MQLLESIISFVVLLSLSALMLAPADSGVDDSLYRYKLMGDAKNVIHLKGGFLDLDAGNAAADEIYRLTGLCVEMDYTDITSRRVGQGAVSGPALVPQIRLGNLTGFEQDRFRFGPCSD